ncbi:MAG: sulfatase-like hydrolase/transferase [Muribaculaceae bacterium]|nr:sulfatase-like hydrolase/transferase [Muribaculaceae bacterium]
MKHFKEHTFANLLLLIVPLSLAVPNLYVCCLNNISFVEWIAALVLPLGLYALLMAVSRKTSRTSALLFPLMFLGAFQIVVSYLYNNGYPIGVDMFLNVSTTNIMEAHELLSGISISVTFVVVLYLPTFIMSIIGWKRQWEADEKILRLARKIGLAVTALGTAGYIYCAVSLPSYRISSDVFPFNALYDFKEMIVREHRLSSYPETSNDFSYGASSNDKENQLYIAVIGETSRADNWGILGYSRNTNPRLSNYGDSIISFGKVFSESNTTHKSVPMLLNTLSSENFDDEIYRHKSIITAFKEAGFKTYVVSMQKPNGSLIERYMNEADVVYYAGGTDDQPDLDETILPLMDAVIADKGVAKKLIVVHLYGSHYNYSDRYPANYSIFTPDKCAQANYENLRNLRNAYDNTVVYTDHVLSEMISKIKSADYNAALIYTSDHGEDIFDDSRKKFLHASPVPTYWQLHVPFIIFMNPSYRAAHPDYIAGATANRGKMISSSKSYSHTLLQLAGISSRYFNASQSLLDKNFKPSDRLLYLDDLNESMDLMKWGFTDFDKRNLQKVQKSAR